MEHILKANPDVMKILGDGTATGSKYRLIKYLEVVEISSGVLMFNTLTRELVFLTKEEFENVFSLEYMKQHWYVIPDEFNEEEQLELIRWVYETRRTNKYITEYTILSTTECNARCHYCYEKQYKKHSMTKETADQVVKYILTNSGEEKIRLCWFGGEPLVNVEIIDYICSKLRENNTVFFSNMISNGYLMDKVMIKKAKNDWNLKKIQITLDGTEDTYNAIKSYIYDGGSPFIIVMDNIRALLDADVSVQIRLNMNPNNAEDLLALVYELGKKFGNDDKICVYSHFILDSLKPQNEWYTDDEWEKLYQYQEMIERVIRNEFVGSKSNHLSRRIKVNHCMADSGTSRVIAPDGRICLCEHCEETEYVGSVFSSVTDNEKIAEWNKQAKPLPQCKDCSLYPECYEIEKCPSHMSCNEFLRRARVEKTRYLISEEYQEYLKKV